VGQDIVTKLLWVVRESIVHIQSTATDSYELAVLRRALAHLWSAHDELEALSTRRWGRGGR
jgi:hypothetical protein